MSLTIEEKALRDQLVGALDKTREIGEQRLRELRGKPLPEQAFREFSRRRENLLQKVKKTKRARGTGHLTPRGKDVWQARICLGRTADGKRVTLNKTIRGTHSEAQKWINDTLAKKDTGAICKLK